MTEDPKNKDAYKRKTGKGAVGVELVVPSVTRGNMDESGVPKFIIPLVQRLSRNLNPHHVWCQFSKHGYTTLNVTPEHCDATFYYTNILKKTDKVRKNRTYRVVAGTNHWNKKPIRK